jgi:hypothetical protein
LSVTATSTGLVAYANSTYSQSQTVPAGTDLLVLRHVNRDNGDVVSASSWNSVALTKIDSQINGINGYATMWYLLAPATGAHTFSITLDGSSHRCGFDLLYLSGAHQSTPFGTVSKTSGSSTSMSLTITDGAVGDMVIDLGFLHQAAGAPSPSVTGGQTSDMSGAGGGGSTASTDPYLVGSHVAGAASVTPGWSWTGSFAFAYMAIDVKAAAAAGAAVTEQGSHAYVAAIEPYFYS